MVVVDATLQIGEVTQSVTAEAEAPLVETTSTQLGAVMNSRSVVDLPLNTRDTYQLLQLQPGVQSQQGYSLFAGSENAGVVSVNGGRGRVEQFQREWRRRQRPVRVRAGHAAVAGYHRRIPRPDQHVRRRVRAEFRLGGERGDQGRHQPVPRRCSTSSSATPLWTRAASSIPRRPDFHQNQFGGTFGGPIKKNKTFFFASVEDRQIVQGLPSDLVTVPTQAERNGDFSRGHARTADHLRRRRLPTITWRAC